MTEPNPPSENAHGAGPQHDRAAIWRYARATESRSGPTVNPASTLGGTLALADTVSILLGSVGAYALRHGPVSIPLDIVSTTLLAVLLMLNTMRAAGGYRFRSAQPTGRQLAEAARAWTIVCALLLMLAYLTKLSDEFSRTWAIGWFSLSLAGIHRGPANDSQTDVLTGTIAILDDRDQTRPISGANDGADSLGHMPGLAYGCPFVNSLFSSES